MKINIKLTLRKEDISELSALSHLIFDIEKVLYM